MAGAATSGHLLRPRPAPKTILVTRPGPGEGKTTTAANLATVLSQAGSSTVLVDADLRRPTLHLLFQTANSFGLTGLMLTDLEDPAQALLILAMVVAGQLYLSWERIDSVLDGDDASLLQRATRGGVGRS